MSRDSEDSSTDSHKYIHKNSHEASMSICTSTSISTSINPMSLTSEQVSDHAQSRDEFSVASTQEYRRIPSSQLSSPRLVSKRDNTITLDQRNEKAARRLVELTRKKLVQEDYYRPLIENLRRRVDLIVSPQDASPNGSFLEIILSGWAEELFRFLAIKTISNDTTVPFILAPSYLIDEAWKILMMMPSAYKVVCQTLGNEIVIDYDPLSESCQGKELSRFKNRHHKTTKIYKQYFNQDPPKLFWPTIIEENGSYMNRSRRKDQTWRVKIANLFHCKY